MLLSETCMLASQQSLLPKRLHCNEEERNASSKDNGSSINSSKVLKRPHKLNEEYVSNKKTQRPLTCHQICEQQNGKVDDTCNESIPMDYSSDSSKLQHSEDYFNNFSDGNNTSQSADNDSEQSNIDSIMISPIDDEKSH